MSKPEKEIKVTEKMYDTLLRPVITEKAMRCSENGQVVFRIPLEATKPEVKAAVEALFGVKVKSVNTVRVSGKWNTPTCLILPKPASSGICGTRTMRRYCGRLI